MSCTLIKATPEGIQERFDPLASCGVAVEVGIPNCVDPRACAIDALHEAIATDEFEVGGRTAVDRALIHLMRSGASRAMGVVRETASGLLDAQLCVDAGASCTRAREGLTLALVTRMGSAGGDVPLDPRTDLRPCAIALEHLER